MNKGKEWEDGFWIDYTVKKKEEKKEGKKV